MSDFLSRLAERAIGRGEVVQPRIAPLFADDWSLDTPALHEPLRLDESGLMPEAGIRAAPAEGSPLPLSGPLVSPASPLSASASAPIASVPASPAASMAQMPRRLALPDTGQPVIGTEPASMKVATRSVSEPETARREQRHAAPGDEAIHAPLPETRRDSDTLMVLTPLVARRSEPAPESGLRGEVQAARVSVDRVAEPVVKVTIGRIDVRAVMPAPPPPSRPAARPGPELTLEEYVKQRREGLR